MRRRWASATATTRRTAGSEGCAVWSPHSSPRRCCTVTCIPTARPHGGTVWAAPRCATSPDGTCSSSSRAPGWPNCSLVVAMPDTGFPRADVENDFLRARRRQSLARLAQWLRRGPDDVNLILPFDEVVAALGMRGERRRGLDR